MKKKLKEENRAKSIEELSKEAVKIEDEINRLKVELMTGKLKNTSLIKCKKDELSIIKTIIREARIKNS